MPLIHCRPRVCYPFIGDAIRHGMPALHAAALCGIADALKPGESAFLIRVDLVNREMVVVRSVEGEVACA